MQDTNADLYGFHTDAKANANTFFGRMLSAKIKAFYKDNNVRLEILLEQMNALSRKYFEFEGDVFKLTDPNDPKSSPVLLPGMTMEGYEKEFETLMKKPIIIKF